MSQPPDQPPDQPPSVPPSVPEQPGPDDEVRRLLADARHDDPMPADVVARMDRVLAGLAGQAVAPEDGLSSDADPSREHVVDLAARRRRRVVGLLVAAAAVVAVGVGMGQLFGGLGGSDGSATSAADRAETGAPRSGARTPVGGGAGPLVSTPSPEAGPDQAPAFADAPRLRPNRFAADVDRARVLAPSLVQPGLGVCEPVAAGAGRRVLVRYAGVPAVLVLRAAGADGSRVADLYACGGRRVERSVTLPAP